jgi:hypothetical protein
VHGHTMFLGDDADIRSVQQEQQGTKNLALRNTVPQGREGKGREV